MLEFMYNLVSCATMVSCWTKQSSQAAEKHIQKVIELWLSE